MREEEGCPDAGWSRMSRNRVDRKVPLSSLGRTLAP